MPDRPEDPPRRSDDGRDEAYDWLYEQRHGDGGSAATDQPDDSTQVIPTGPRRDGPPPPPPTPPPSSSASSASSEQRTQALPPLPPPNLPPPGASAASARPVGDAGRQPPGSGGPGGPQRPTPRPRKRRITVGRVLLVLFLVWILFLVAVPLWGWNQIEKVDATPDGERPAEQPGTTYLVVGSDSRDGLDSEERQDLSTGGDAGGGRTDTIMLLHVGSGPPLLLSIPRDSPVDIPGRGESRINSAFNGDGGGPQLLVETVEQNTGIRVDNYVEVGFGGFVNIVDGLGGVEICPDDALVDPKAGLDIDAGCQEADGVTALGYARTRDFALADLARVANQREVIGAIGDKAASPWTVLNPVRYLRTIGSGAGSLRIGDEVGPIDLTRFAWNMGSVTGGDGLSCTVPNNTTTTSLDWDVERAEELFSLIREDRTDEGGRQLCTDTGQPG